MKYLLVLLLMGLLAAGEVEAGSPELQRADLTRLVDELDYWLAEVKALEARAPETGRTRLDYTALSQDLAQIRRRLAAHLQADLLQFNPLAPLSGEPEPAPPRRATDD